MATIGRAAAVARIGPLHLSGFVGWLVVHIFWLIGFENRMVVVVPWTWWYVTGQRGTRLITRQGLLKPAEKEPVGNAENADK